MASAVNPSVHLNEYLDPRTYKHLGLPKNIKIHLFILELQV